jgi:hypothetical protein
MHFTPGKLFTYLFTFAVVIGVGRRLGWVVNSHGSLCARGLTLALSALALVMLIDSIRRHEQIWPPTRRQYGIAVITVAIVCFVDVPGYLSLIGNHAKDQIISRAESGKPDAVKDMEDGSLVAMGDDFIGGTYTRWPHLYDDINGAFNTTAATCPAAIAKIEADERGFESEAITFAAVDDARAHAKCAVLTNHDREARAWIEQAARHELPPPLQPSADYNRRLWMDASLIAAGLHDQPDLIYFSGKAKGNAARRASTDTKG